MWGRDPEDPLGAVLWASNKRVDPRSRYGLGDGNVYGILENDGNFAIYAGDEAGSEVRERA